MNTEAITRGRRFARINFENSHNFHNGFRYRYRICFYSNQEDDGDGGFVCLMYYSLIDAILTVAIFGIFGRVRKGKGK